MGGTKRDDYGSTLQSMTMRDWVERVCHLQNSVEHRDRVIAEQKKTIASQLAIIERLRATDGRPERCDRFNSEDDGGLNQEGTGPSSTIASR